MDVLKYVESNTIRNYLKRKNYKFSSVEAAWLIWYNSSHTIEEYHNDWQWIIDNMPDSPIPERRNCREWPSLHGLLRAYISYEKQMIQEFERTGETAVYSYSFICEADQDWCEEFQNAYSSLEKCTAAVLEELPEERKRTQIRKTFIDNNDYILASYNNDMKITNIEKSNPTKEEIDIEHNSFAGMWFDFPTPFHFGDMVKDKYGNLFVLTHLPSWIHDPDNPQEVAFMKELLDYDWDSSDMLAGGYGVSEDGLIWREHIYNSYLDLEYAVGEFEDENRLIEALYLFFKRKIDIATLNTLHTKVLLENLEKSLHMERFNPADLKFLGFYEEIKK